VKKKAGTAVNQADFFEKVYRVVAEIPPGRVCSYGLIAEFLGARSSARLVGYAMNAVGDREEIPAHRVVNRVGLLTGKYHFGHPDTMKNRLLAEGVRFLNDDQVDFRNHVWIPAEELPTGFRMQLVRE